MVKITNKPPIRTSPAIPRLRVAGNRAAAVLSTTLAMPRPLSMSGQPDVFRSRQLHQRRWEQCFRYGRMEDDHPVSLYVNSLLLRLGDAGVGKRVIICPHWKEINAEMYADGVILLSGRLLSFCEYEEELLGVLGHEIQHHKGDHIKAKAGQEEDFLKGAVRELGLVRAQEISADIQGSIALLDSQGINPAGFKRFSRRLYELKSKFRSPDASMTHGSWLGRYLQAAETFHVYDFTSLTRHLEPIPDEQKRAIVECDQIENKGKILLRSITKDEAERIIPLLTLKEAFFAMDRLIDRTDDKTGILQMLFRHIYTQMEALCPLAENEGNEALQWTLWALALNRPPSSVLERLGTHITPELILKTLDRITELDPDIFLSNNIRKIIFDKLKGLGFIKHSSYEDYYSFVRDLYEVLNRLFQKKGTRLINKTEFFDHASECFVGDNVARFERALQDGYLSKGAVLPQSFVAAVPAEAKAVFDRLGKITDNWSAHAKTILQIFEGNRGSIRQALICWINVVSEPTDYDYAGNIARAQLVLGAVKLYEAVLQVEAGRPDITIPIALELLDFRDMIGYLRQEEGLKLLAEAYELERNQSEAGKDWEEKTAKLDKLREKMRAADPESIIAGIAPSAEDLRLVSRFPALFYKSLCQYFCVIKGGKVVSEILKLQESGLDILNQQGNFGYLLSRIFSNAEKELSGLSGIDKARFLLAICPWVTAAHVKQKLQKYALDLMWEYLSFDEKVKLLFGQDGPRVILDNERRDRFIEEEANTFQEIAQVREVLEKTVDDAVATGNVQVGIAAALSTLNLSAPGKARSVVDMLLETKSSDRALKMAMWDIITEQRQFLEVQDFTRIINVVEWLSQFLLSLGEFGKYLLVRSLLVTSGKILVDKNERSGFVKALLAKSLAEPKSQAEESAQQIIDDVVGVVGLVEEWEPLYFALAGYLRPRIAVPPKKTYDLSEDYYLQSKVISSCEAGFGFRRKEKRKYGSIATYTELRAIETKDARAKPWEHDNFYAAESLPLIESWISRQVEKQKHEARAEKIDAFSFILEVAGTMGSVGVRFLQLLPLFVSLRPEAEEKFSQVYDRVKGMSKIVAADILKREYPERASDLEGLGAPIGGGSMRRVYRSRTRQGEKRVVRVLNPNSKYKAQEMFDYLEKIIDLLNGKDNKDYQTAKLILAYVKEWIEQDIAMTQESAILDRDYKKENDASSRPGFRYAIYVPQTYGSHNTHWQLEEEIEGYNLTDWDQLLKDGHDMKQITCLLVNNYFMQLNNGVVHSDVSIGNVRIMPDNRIAWLDRNFLINLTSEENALIFGLLVGDNQARKETLLGYFRDRLAAKDLSEIDDLAEQLFKSDGDPAQKIQQFMISIFGMGVKLPLSIVLVLKNLLVLDKLTKKAGFAGLAEAYMFTSPESQ